MAKRSVITTRLDIVRCATRLFLEQGYTGTTPRHIMDALGIGTGKLTYHFPTKEHMLAVLVEMLCDFQWKMIGKEVGEGYSSVMARCLELTAMAAICETDPAAKDFYISAYTSPMCLEIIRKNDTERAKNVFREYCPDWTDEQFAEAELLVSGIEYATLMTVGDPVSLQTRIAGALNQILQIYRVPVDVRKAKIIRVLQMDYHSIARRILAELKQFVEDANEHALNALYEEKGLAKPQWSLSTGARTGLAIS